MPLAALTGTLVAKLAPSPANDRASVQLSCGFATLALEVLHSTLATLPPVGSEVTLHTHLLIKPEAWQLLGFTQRAQRDVFALLLTANGVGAKHALALLEALSVAELVSAIVAENHKPLTAAKGVGSKLAQKLVLELHTKLTRWQQEAMATLPELAPAMGNTPQAQAVAQWQHTEAWQDAQSLLLSLGYDVAEITQAGRAVAQTLPEADLNQPMAWQAEYWVPALLKYM
jgi:Holliday junction DNA helicase RuvA